VGQTGGDVTLTLTGDRGDDWQRQHAERVEQLLARIDEALSNVVDVISRSEVLHRVKFAEKYSDREEVSNMLDTYRTWREIVHNALYVSELVPDRTAPYGSMWRRSR
jgi:hypothetical protein